MTRTHEAVTQGREDLVASREGMQRELEKHQETIKQYGQRINSMFNMVSSPPQFKLPPEFLPRSITNPSHFGHGILPRPAGMVETNELSKVDTRVQVRGLTPHTTNHAPKPHSKIPTFNGSKPRWWICRCKRFVQLYNVMEGQEVNLTTADLNDTIDSWYQGWTKTKEMEAGWNEFAEELCERFRERNMYDVIEEFKTLKQVRIATKYLDKFEELRALMWNAQPTLTK